MIDSDISVKLSHLGLYELKVFHVCRVCQKYELNVYKVKVLCFRFEYFMLYWIYHPHPGHHLVWSNSNCIKYITFQFHTKHIYIYISNFKCVKHIFMVRDTLDTTPSLPPPWVCSDNHKSRNITPKRSFCFTITINFANKGELQRKKTFHTDCLKIVQRSGSCSIREETRYSLLCKALMDPI